MRHLLNIDNSRKIKICLLLFVLALSIRIIFYLLGSLYLPDNFQKFVTADTRFYYDPLALNMASQDKAEMSLLQITRATFLGYLAVFYRYFGHIHWPVSIFHCFLGALSVVLLFLFSQFFVKKKSAYIIGLVAALHIVLVYWTPFVNTEASFFLILSLCLFLCGLFVKTRRMIYALALLAGLIIASVSRPSGMVFSLFLLLYSEWVIFKKMFGPPKHIIYFCLTNVVIFITLIILLVNFSRGIDKVIEQPYPQELLHLSLYIDQIDGLDVDKDNLKVHSARLSLPLGMRIPKVDAVPSKIKRADIFSYFRYHRSEERRVGKECRSRWSPYH